MFRAHAASAAVRRAAESEFPQGDLWDVFEQQAARCTQRPLIIWQPFDQKPTTLTYAEVARQARRVAAGLQKRGVLRCDRILIHLDNCPEFLIAWLACAAVGAVAVTTNTRLSADELRYAIENAGVSAAITQPRLAAVVGKAGPDLRWVAVTSHDSGVPTAASFGRDGFGHLVESQGTWSKPGSDLLRPLSVQYTSGTTARPKGVVWTHANGLWAARESVRNEDLKATDCHFTYLPLFHANAMAFSVLPTLWAGGRLLLTPKWSTSRFWDLSTTHHCTWASLIGLSLRAIMSMPAPQHHAYRYFGTGLCAEELPGVGVKTIGWWGMTETIAPGIVGDVMSPNPLGVIGRQAPSYEVSVRGTDGQEVEVGAAGRLYVRATPGLSLFSGYLNDPEATRTSFDADGWFDTGDQVSRQPGGYFSFVDRDKDMLRVGAENVAASEVERVLESVPGVLEAAVVSRPDVKLDEVPVAFVRADTRNTEGIEAAALDRCRSMLADFKIPRAIYVVAELPRSTISKVNKVALRSVAAEHADRHRAEQEWLSAARSDPSGDAG